MTTPVNTPFGDAFLFEAERHAAWGAAQLQALMAFMPDGDWTADLDACVYRQGGLDLRVSVLGTYDMSEGSWMWGWANPGLRGTPVVALSGRAGEYGRAYGIPEFAQEVLDLSGFADPRRAAEMLAFAAMGVTGAPGYLSVQAGPDTQLYLLADDARVPRPAFAPSALPGALTSSIGLIGHSPYAMVAGYFEHFGLPHHQEPGRIAAALPGGLTAGVDFDGLGRIANIRVTLNEHP
ncbi:DUF6882 domain-containing protein [Streptomyces sp. NPDC059564]|uniref:DUF6882 domain-containing protein n=1 Tax=Streptomyces sp. NPDC059564 TaxID=3346865 RepID=UPI0036ABD592